MLIGLIVNLRFLDEYGELETVRPRIRAEALVGAVVGASG